MRIVATATLALCILASPSYAEYGTNADRGYGAAPGTAGMNAMSGDSARNASDPTESSGMKESRGAKYDAKNPKNKKKINRSIDKNANQRDAAYGGSVNNTGTERPSNRNCKAC